jgi:ELWxxDGT repeat protein
VFERLEAREQPSATLVQDINPGPPDSTPTELVDRRGTLFFAADNGVQGRELWVKRPSGQTVLLRDINPGPAGSDPQSLTIVRGILYFSADDGLFGRELWRSDGTTPGTFLVRDINPGPDSSDPSELISYRRTAGRPALLYFAADDGFRGRELWRSAGAASNTRIVRDINPGPDGSDPAYLTFGPLRNQRNRFLFFRADDGAFGAELWRSNGTLNGTVLVQDIRPGQEGSNPFNLTRVNLTQTGNVFQGAVFFGADDGFRGAELWRSDGRAPGTMIVRDINPGPDGSMIESATSLMANFRGQLLFAADDGVFGRELWRSNGTPGGTVLVRDINPGSASSNPGMQAHPLQDRRYLILQRANNQSLLLFAADDGLTGSELWRTSGTTASTLLIRDINPGPGSGLLNNQLVGIVFRNHAYFAASDGDNVRDNELWRSNGAFAGTELWADINPGANPSDPDNFAISTLIVNGNRRRFVFFAADDGLRGRELWRAD